MRRPPRQQTLSTTPGRPTLRPQKDRKSTRLNSSHTVISYAVFCLKKKNVTVRLGEDTRQRGHEQAVLQSQQDARRPSLIPPGHQNTTANPRAETDAVSPRDRTAWLLRRPLYCTPVPGSASHLAVLVRRRCLKRAGVPDGDDVPLPDLVI